MNEELHETLCVLFIEIQKPWAIHCPPNRTNFFNYTYTLYQLCVLLDQTQYLPFIPMMKDREKQLEQAQIVIDSIKTDAEKTAMQVKSAILNDGKAEIERLTASAKSQVTTIEAKVRKQISDYVVTLALQRVTLQLEGKLNSNLQQQIIDRNISKLSD
mgnify:CR=1 FL=1